MENGGIFIWYIRCRGRIWPSRRTAFGRVRDDWRALRCARQTGTAFASRPWKCAPLPPQKSYVNRLAFIILSPSEEAAFSAAAELISALIGDLLPKNDRFSALVVGLGNRAITPDAVGPQTMESVLATRHLQDQAADLFSALRPVCAISPGVLGTTGIEAARMVKAVSADLRPDVVIVVDALACSEPERLCRTIQITDTGITPGSGVGNDREALNRDSLGVPVIAVGVPTVMDIRTVSDSDVLEGLFVTPRDIDTTVSDFSKLTGYAINLALQPELLIPDLDLLLS